MIEASDALAEHSGLIFNTHMAAQNYHSSSRKGMRYCFLASSSVLGTHVICTQANTYIHKKFFTISHPTGHKAVCIFSGL